MKPIRKALHPAVWTIIGAAVFLLALSTFHVVSRFRSGELFTVDTSRTQDDDAATTALISSLWSANTDVRTDSEKRLIAFAQSSPPKRELVISKLLSSVNAEKELDGKHNVLESSFLFWQSVTNIFAELDAKEAVAVLIRCVQCSNGFSGNMGEPPASYALVLMGKPVLPALSNALSQERDAYKRMKMVLCISRIGGPEAISYLEQALQFESHKDVREAIQFNLAEMRSK